MRSRFASFSLVMGLVGGAALFAACNASEDPPSDDGGTPDGSVVEGGPGDDGAIGPEGGGDAGGGSDAGDGGESSDASDASDAGSDGASGEAGAGDDAGPPGPTFDWNGSYDLPANGVCSIQGWCIEKPLPTIDGFSYVWGPTWSGAAAGELWLTGSHYVASAGGDAILHYKNGAWTGLTGLPSTNIGPISGSGPDDVWIGKLHWDGATLAVNPKPPPGSVPWFASPTDAWSVGTSAWHWDGATWTAVATGTVKTLTAVVGFASNDVWAVGSTALRHWDGVAWNDPPVAMPAGAAGSFVGGTSSSNLWVAGGGFAYHFDGATWTTRTVNGTVVAVTNSWVITTSNAYRATGSSLVSELASSGACTRCGGCNTAWQSSQNGDLLIVANAGPASPTTQCPIWVRGTSGGFALASQNPATEAIDVFEAAGTTFSISTTGKLSYAGLWGITLSDTASSLNGTSATDVWVAGTSAPAGVASHWDGAAFTAYDLEQPASSEVGIASPTSAWVLTKSAAGALGAAYFDGATWTTKAGPTADFAASVWGPSATDAWAVGKRGCQHWDGAVWTAVPCVPGVAAGSLVSLAKVWGTGTNDVWAFANTGRVVHWNGVGWFEHAPPGPISAITDGFSVTAWNDVWATGSGSILKHWNGYAWQPVLTGAVASSKIVVSVTGGYGRAILSNGTVLTRTP